jgi:protein arginine kinase
MLHLIALAHTARLPGVLKALNVRNLTARGLFGESSRAVGAFLQVSLTDGVTEDFVGACDYLLREERHARVVVRPTEIRDRLEQTRDFVARSPKLSLAESLRALAWARWAAASELVEDAYTVRDVDLWMVHLRLDDRSDAASTERARYLRKALL